MKNWPLWIPFPNSWMSAILLTMLTGSLAYTAKITWQVAYWLARFSPRLGILVGVLALLSPILLIAITHHLIHWLTDHFFPNTQAPAMKNKGLIPGLMSWWEGLYGWLVLILSTLISIGILGPFFPSFQLIYQFSWWDKTPNFLAGSTILWLVIAACLYQFQYIVQRHLLSTGFANNPERQP